jgi:hypothetical protein
MKKARKHRTHFVPKVVYRTAFAGVVPLCVAGTACSGGGSGGVDSGPTLTVACSGFCNAVGVAAFTDAGEASPDVQSEAAGDATQSDSCYCCTNLCGVGIAAFTDANDEG